MQSVKGSLVSPWSLVGAAHRWVKVTRRMSGIPSLPPTPYPLPPYPSTPLSTMPDFYCFFLKT